MADLPTVAFRRAAAVGEEHSCLPTVVEATGQRAMYRGRDSIKRIFYGYLWEAIGLVIESQKGLREEGEVGEMVEEG